MGTGGICLFVAGKNEIPALGFMIHQPKKIENRTWIDICAGQSLGRWDLCSWTLGFSHLD
jgi:hypothetical protein